MDFFESAQLMQKAIIKQSIFLAHTQVHQILEGTSEGIFGRTGIHECT